MAKTNKKIRVKSREVVRAKRRTGPRAKSVMSAALSNHLHMVVDPCNAPLTETAYPNASGVIRDRRKFLYNVSHTPATTAGTYSKTIAWHPIMGGFELSVGAELFPSANATNCTFTPVPSLFRFADTNAFYSARGVGGCLSVSWTGKELDRRGIVYSGVVSGGLVWTHLAQASGGSGTQISPSVLAASLTTTCRTPNDKCEVTWVPTEYDSTFMDLVPYTTANNSALQEQLAKLNFVVMVCVFTQAVGEAVSLGYTSLSIAEVNPAVTVSGGSNVGLVQDAAHVNSSGIPGAVTSIVRTLQMQDTNWYINTFKKIGKFGLRAIGAYGRGGALGLVAEVAGMTVSSRRNINA